MKSFTKKLEQLLETGGTKKDITFLVLSGIALLSSIFWKKAFPVDPAWVAIIFCGIPIILEAVIGLVTEFDIKADVLVSLALIASVCIREDFAVGEVAFIMQLGGLLEELTVAKARAGIEKLVHLTPQTARIIGHQGKKNADEKIISAEQVVVDDILRVLPGETIPVDGVILSGQTSINQAVMTGESLPVDKTVGDEVASGTVNQFGAFEMRATKHGFLVREGDVLERLAKVSKITFDKTGTLTYGTPKVIAVKNVSPKYSEEDIYRFCAASEMLSEHPLGKAVVSCFKKEKKESLLKPEEFQMIPGRGVSCVEGGKKILAGNREMMEENQIPVSNEVFLITEEYLKQGCTLIYLATDGELAGYLALADTIREESTAMIDALKALQVDPVLLTGDHENAAQAIAGQLHIEEVHAQCLPEDKLNWIDSYQKKAEQVCMIGDGINDAPALKKADVGIAMGGVGSDIAVDAADITLVDDEVKELPHLLVLSRRMMFTIKCNMSFSMGLNFLAIVLAILGILNPVVGALVHNAGSVLVIINSALLLNWKKE